MYLYILCLSVCLLVSAIKVRTAEPIGHKFCVGPHMTQRRFIGNQNLTPIFNVQILIFLNQYI